jgi:hypothetical protein
MAVLPRRARALAVLALSAASVLAGADATRAQDPPSPSPTPRDADSTQPGPADQIVLSGAVTVRRGDEVGEIIVVRGSVVIAGLARGDVVVVDGRILVTGQVSGTIVNIDGPVTLGSNAHVLGDVIARERVRVAEGAIVEGDVREGTAFIFRSPAGVFGRFATWLAVSVSTAILVGLLLLVAPRATEAVARTAEERPLASSVLGVTVAVALPLIAVLAAVTLVGLPFALALLLALWLIASLGFAMTVFAVGRRLWNAPRSRWVALLFGWLVVSAVSAIPWVGGVVWGLGAVFGLGASAVAIRSASGERATERAEVGRHRAARGTPRPASIITERAMEQERTGI